MLRPYAGLLSVQHISTPFGRQSTDYSTGFQRSDGSAKRDFVKTAVSSCVPFSKAWASSMVYNQMLMSKPIHPHPLFCASTNGFQTTLVRIVWSIDQDHLALFEADVE